MAFCYECAAISHIGSRRRNHEDNFFIGELLTPDEQASLSQSGRKYIQKNLSADNSRNRIFAVSDGMGGHRDGEVASCMVAEALRSFTDDSLPKAFRRRRDKFAYVQNFQNMVRQTNRKMLECSDGGRETDHMGATLSGIILFADETAPFNIGDSSTFLFENDELKKLTVDDNEASWFEKNVRGEPEAKGRRLTKYFGLPESSGVLTAAISDPVPIREGQIFLISSDGLTDCMPDEKIAGVLADHSRDIRKTADILIESALAAENGGRDNITAVLLKIKKARPKGRPEIPIPAGWKIDKCVK